MNKVTIKQRFILAVVLSVAALTTGVARAGCGAVTITDMNWPSSQVVTAVSKFLMEQGYGCEVTAVPSATNTALVSLAENGTPDIVTEIWINSTPAILKMRDAGKVKILGRVLPDGGQQGWWVPQYMVDEHPELATLKGVLANSKLLGGRLHSCPDGWACKTINENLARATGLKNSGFEVFVHGSGETLGTSLLAAYSEKKPWFGYYWAPTPMLGNNPMVLVDLGPYDQKAHECNKKEDCASPGISPYPYDEVLTVVTTSFEKREPEIAELMSKVSFTNLQMGELLAWQESKSASAEETAVYFLTKYKKVWSTWLNDGARSKLSTLLN